MYERRLVLVYFLFLLFYQNLFSQEIKAGEKQTEVKKPKIIEDWQTNPEAFAKLFYGDDLTLRPPSKDPTFISKPEISEKVTGSYIEWPAKYGINPGWYGMTEKGKKLISGNATVFSLLSGGYIQIDGSRVEGEQKIDSDEMTWGIPPNADINVKIKIEFLTTAVILRNGMLMIIVSGSDLTIKSLSETCDWPPYVKKFDMFKPLFGPSNPEVRVSNTLGSQVKVGLRSGEKGIDFIVPTTGDASVFVPKEKYEIYFHYSTDPSSLYKGDSFELKTSGIEIKLGKTIEGNYNIKKVK